MLESSSRRGVLVILSRLECGEVGDGFGGLVVCGSSRAFSEEERKRSIGARGGNGIKRGGFKIERE